MVPEIDLKMMRDVSATGRYALEHRVGVLCSEVQRLRDIVQQAEEALALGPGENLPSPPKHVIVQTIEVLRVDYVAECNEVERLRVLLAAKEPATEPARPGLSCVAPDV